MREVRKYVLADGEVSEIGMGVSFRIELPELSNILSGGFISGQRVVWALVDDLQPKTTKTVLVISSGLPLDVNMRLHYLNTIVAYETTTQLVWHFFEVQP